MFAGDTRRQFFFVITTTASTHCLVENDRQWWFKCFKIVERLSRCSGETLLALCDGKKRLQRKMTKDYYWVSAKGNIGMFRKAGFPVMAETTRRHFKQ